MRILVGKCFGIGNAVMAVPMVKALATIGTVDVLLGTGIDDAGSIDVMLQLQGMGVVNQLHLDTARVRRYDIAVMAIPFDGRWQNGRHFFADRVVDCRPRPGFCPDLGFDSWLKHEVEYQMDDARQLGYTGQVPSMGFMESAGNVDSELVYLGLGFKRDAGSFWSTKHWGNDRYVAFIRRCRELRPSIRFRSTGNPVDIAVTLAPISREAAVDLGPATVGLAESFSAVAGCGSYFGNDTGMMHVAASFDKPTYGMMAYENVATKNRPWCSRWAVNEFFRGESDPTAVADDFVRFVWGTEC